MTQFHGILLNPRDLFKKRRPTQPAVLDTASNSTDLTQDADGSEEQSTRRNSDTSFIDLMRLMDD